MKEARNYNELLGAFRDNLCDIKSEKDLVWVLRLLSRYYELMQEVQRLPWLLRLKFFACTFLIFNYLHYFSRTVRKNVFKLFSVLMENKTNENK